MKFEFHVFHHLGASAMALLERIAMDAAQQTEALKVIGAGLTTLGTTLDTAGVALVRGLGEVTSEISALKDQVAAQGNSAPEMDDLFTSILAKVQTAQASAAAISTAATALDALNPDTGGGTTPTPAG